MRTTADPSRHSLYLALGAVGLLPVSAALFFGGGYALDLLGVEPPEVLGVIAGAVAFLVIGSSVICVPVALAALGSYRRQTSPSWGRTGWTTLVLVLLSPVVWAAISLVWSLLEG